MTDEPKPLPDKNGAISTAEAILGRPVGDEMLAALLDVADSNPDPLLAHTIRRLVAEVRHLRLDAARLHFHHMRQDLEAGLDPTRGQAVDELKAAMAKQDLTPDQAIDPEALRGTLTGRCRTCSEFDGTLPKRDVH